ncbi:hypothetical protein D9M70_492140 [compost metagenome]
MNLPQAGGADRMPLGFQAARRVDRDLAADGEIAAFGGWTTFTEGHQHQRFGIEDFANGRGVMHFSHVDIARRYAGLFVGFSGSEVGNDFFRLIQAA